MGIVCQRFARQRWTTLSSYATPCLDLRNKDFMVSSSSETPLPFTRTASTCSVASGGSGQPVSRIIGTVGLNNFIVLASSLPVVPVRRWSLITRSIGSEEKSLKASSADVACSTRYPSC